MKKIFIILSIIILSMSTTIAQNRNSLRIGVNGAFWGSGDAIGKVIYGEYERTLNSYFSVVPRMSIGYANEQLEWYSSLLSSYTASLSLRATPFQASELSRLKLDAGLLYQSTVKLGINYSSHPSINIVGVDDDIYNLFGFLFGLNINIIQTERHVLGVRGEMLTNIDGGFHCDGLQFGVYYGVRF